MQSKQVIEAKSTINLIRRKGSAESTSAGGEIGIAGGELGSMAGLQRRMGNAAFTAMMRSYTPAIQRQD